MKRIHVIRRGLLFDEVHRTAGTQYGYRISEIQRTNTLGAGERSESEAVGEGKPECEYCPFI